MVAQKRAVKEECLLQILPWQPSSGQPFSQSPANMHWQKIESQKVFLTSQQAMGATDLQVAVETDL